jgi:hypothetical protein
MTRGQNRLLVTVGDRLDDVLAAGDARLSLPLSRAEAQELSDELVCELEWNKVDEESDEPLQA